MAIRMNRDNATVRPDTYIASVLLLCTECQQPIKATITTPQWVKVEWIGPEGECQACHTLKKREREVEG